MNTSIEGMLPVSGSVLDANGRIVNLVDLLGGGTRPREASGKVRQRAALSPSQYL